MSRWQQKKLYGRTNIQKTTDAYCWLISPGLPGLQKISQILILFPWYQRDEQSHWSLRELMNPVKGFSHSTDKVVACFFHQRKRLYGFTVERHKIVNKCWALLLRWNKYSGCSCLPDVGNPIVSVWKAGSALFRFEEIRCSNALVNNSEALIIPML